MFYDFNLAPNKTNISFLTTARAELISTLIIIKAKVKNVEESAEYVEI